MLWLPTTSVEQPLSRKPYSFVTSLDAALFDSYNPCDLEKFATFFVEDVEFYHDQGGVTLGKEKLTDSVRKNICEAKLPICGSTKTAHGRLPESSSYDHHALPK